MSLLPDKKIGSVFIVDDEPIIREMLQVELEKQYDVYTAEDAVKAFDILDQTAIDLVISDINMPGMKGFDLIKKVKEKYAGTKTILITAYNVNDYIRMAKEYDISNIISKSTPFNFDESEAVKIYVGRDSEKYGVSILDTSGKLTKETVLYKIDRHIHAEGLMDEDGRGLHMSRLYSDRLIINIKKDVATEAIFLNYLNDKYKGFKPLYINEI